VTDEPSRGSCKRDQTLARGGRITCSYLDGVWMTQSGVTWMLQIAVLNVSYNGQYASIG
jgi:hypothetical protein